jgi:predicted GNAT family acetyltransferase
VISDEAQCPLVQGLADARAFLDTAGTWLRRTEDRNNLMLSVVRSRISHRTQAGERDYFAVVRHGPHILGCAMRTPPHKLLLTDMDPAAVACVAADVARRYTSLPAVMGPPDVAALYAREWKRLRSVRIRPGMRQRLYVLRRVTPPSNPPPGDMRAATTNDLELLVDWFRAFGREADVMIPTKKEDIQRRTVDGSIYVWEDGSTTSLAGVGGRTIHGARVGPVYTPPDRRGRGYATALVARLSQKLLDEGLEHCVLFTDLSNATSNRIYQAVGYEPLCDARDFVFEIST